MAENTVPPDGSEFYKQLGGSATANLIFAVGFMIYKIFSQKCQHSKCKSNTKCFQCSAQEDSINESKEDERFQREIKEKMSEMQASINRRLRTKRSSTIPFDGLEIRSSRKHSVAEDRQVEEGV